MQRNERWKIATGQRETGAAKNKNCKTLAEEKEKKKQQKNNDRRKGRDCMMQCDRAHLKTY